MSQSAATLAVTEDVTLRRAIELVQRAFDATVLEDRQASVNDGIRSA